jgi:hypothetical protein
MSDDDLRCLAEAFGEMIDNTPSGEFMFELSAQHLLGSSKILSTLTEPARRALGVASLASVPKYVVVACPPTPQAVVLVENTTSFERAVRAGLHEVVGLIAAYGYGLNQHADSTSGRALIDAVIGGDVEVLMRAGIKPSWPELLSHATLLFWGDLDREGLRIAAALRVKLPQLRLSALYGPMIERAKTAKTCHPYTLASGKQGQLPWAASGQGDLDEIAAICDRRAVDQESLVLAEHRHLATRALCSPYVR